jgi:uncharacterized membrane protein YphA (DoxX/SURF4 family)
VTNQSDESHPLRDRVDEAISWFTQTDELPQPAATPAAVERAPLAEESTSAVGESIPAVGESTSAVGESTSAVGESIPVDAGTRAPEPVADVTPTPVVDDQSLSTPIAANLPGNEAAPVDLHPEPVAAPFEPTPVSAEEPVAAPYLHPTEVAPERIYEADQFSAHLIEAAPVHAEFEPTEVAPERLSEADAFVPTHAATPAVVEPEPIAVEPLPEHVESSAVDEPTRINPIEPPASWAEVHPEAKGLTADQVEAEVETAAAQRSLFRDEAPTVALPAGAFAAGGAVPLVEQTAVLDAQEAARVRREERAARDRQLGKVIAAPDDSDEPLVTKFTTPSTYNGLPSLGFLLFRLVIATVVGIRAWQHITHLSATRDMWAATIVPSPGIIAWTQIGLEIAITVMLVVGLGTRIAGLVLLVLSIAQLALVQWGVVNPFQPGASDFIGVIDVLLAGAGILLATVGGGRLAFDGAIHTSRIRRKNNKLFA